MAKSRSGSILSDIISDKAGKNGSAERRNGSESNEFMLVNYMTENFQ